MNARGIRFGWSLLLAFALVFWLLPTGAVTPVQAGGGGGGEPQWLEWNSAVGTVLSAEYGAAIAESADNAVMVIGARTQTVSGSAQRGAVHVVRRGVGYNQTLTQLTASDGAAGDQFGVSVAVSADGSMALVGAFHADISGRADQGAAYVFTWNGTNWAQQTKLMAKSGGAAGQWFGASVALSADGSTALIGANGYNYNHPGQGAAYVFTRSGTTWTQQTSNSPLIAFDAADNDYLGSAVALSADGNTALVGATGKTSGKGAAYVYTRSGVYWSYQRELTAWDGAAGDDFGHSVSLNSTGDLALIGADNASVNGNAKQGAAYTFTRGGTTWTNGAKLTGAGGIAGDLFGYSVSLSGDGSTALVGAPDGTVPDPTYQKNQGLAYAFYGTGFSSQQKLVPENTKPGWRTGVTVSAGGDGSYLVIGAPGLTWAGSNWGVEFTFTRFTANWVQTKALTNPDGVKNDWLGSSLALSSDGSTALVGTGNMKKAYVYTYHYPGGWTLEATLEANDPNAHNFGVFVALSGDGNTALVGAPDTLVGNNPIQGAVFVFTRSAGQWSAPQEITAPDGAGSDQFGSAVALSADGSTAAVGASSVSGNKGAVYVLTRSGKTWTVLPRSQPSDPTSGAYFGRSVALSTDGSTLLVGAIRALDETSVPAKTTGGAYVFTRASGVYSQQVKLSPVGGYDDSNYGASVSLSGDGNLAMVGSPWWGNGQVYGKVYVYTRSGTAWTKLTEFSAIDKAYVDKFGQGVALSTDGSTAVIGATRADVYGTLYQGAAYVYKRAGNAYEPERKLIPPDAVAGDEDGAAVAISGDGHTLAFNASWKDDGRGAAYFYSDNVRFAVFLPLVVK